MSTAAAKTAEETNSKADDAYQRRLQEKREKWNAYQREYKRRKAEEKRAAKVQAQECVQNESQEQVLPQYPVDSIYASCVNVLHGYSTEIRAEGHSGKNQKTVIVERTHDADGHTYYRTKTTVFSYHRSYSAALKAAKAQRIKIQEFSTGDADAS